MRKVRRKKQGMKATREYIQNHPVPACIILTFIISWGGVLILGAPYGMPATSQAFEANYPIVFIPYLLGPLLSSLILTGLVDGKKGFRKLSARLSAWRAGARWYATAVLLAPALTSALLFALSLVSKAYLPAVVTSTEKASLLLMGISIGFFGGGLMEEPGWTGFMIPRLRKQHNLLFTGLITGFIWGVWHILPTFWGSGDADGVLSLSLLLPPLFFYMAVLPAYRVLMVWVYDNTHSLPVIMLMHASLTASTLFILAPAVQGMQLFFYYLVLAAVLWLIALIIMRNQSHPGKQ